MSWRVANECADRRFGSAARKQIIMFMADKASDDGSGIWCSRGMIQRHTELGESIMKRTISDFLREGILVAPFSGHLARRPSVFLWLISASMALRLRGSTISLGVLRSGCRCAGRGPCLRPSPLKPRATMASSGALVGEDLGLNQRSFRA